MRANQFQEAKDRFTEATYFVKYPITWDVWMTIDDELKCAALYVNFYEQIIFAWQNCRTYFLEDEECISIIMQYLMKNVEKIKAEPKRYTQGYIYTVAFRCLQGIRRVDGTKRYYDTYQSRYIDTEDGELDLLDTLVDVTDCFKTMRMQRTIMGMDDDMKALISHLVFGTRINSKIKKKEDDMIDMLRSQFAEYTDADTSMYTQPKPRKFGDIYKDDDNIESAVCTMSDGESAVYYGEKHIIHSTRQVSIVFFGSKKDYVVPLKIAKELIVTDVEYYS